VWTGDDAALIATGDRTLVTVDSMSEHVDFELDWATGADVGYKLVAINVSDIAAMGGRPTRAVATVQLGDETEPDLIEDIAQGMADAARRWGLDIVGGDIGTGSDLGLTLTLLGELEGEPVLRSGAKAGDRILVTGSLGAAHAGLLLLQLGAVDPSAVRTEIGEGSGADGLAVLAATQLRPRPRAEEGPALAALATAMIDVSDGLAVDLERLCKASGVGCSVDSAAVPVHPDLAHAAGAVDNSPAPLECALAGGEDFELLFTASESSLDEVHHVLDDIGTSVSVIGEITSGACNIDRRPLDEWSRRAWDHLRNQ
jgi:thiamine-monophosphate kinase